MSRLGRLRADLGSSMQGAQTALAAADLLCRACVDLLDVDGASISLVLDGSTHGTFGSSGELSRRLDEYQFTFGEGPCLDSVRQGAAILAPDLEDPAEHRWPAFRGAVLEHGVAAVFALPVAVASHHIGALDLFRNATGSLSPDVMNGSLLAAELAAVPLLDLMTSQVDAEHTGQPGDGWEQLASLERVEVYQATGMVMAALDLTATEALVRLRAQAFARGVTASELAWQVVERRVLPGAEDWGPAPPEPPHG